MANENKVFRVAIAVVIIGIIVYAGFLFAQNTGLFALSNPGQKIIQIGATLPLTGELADYGVGAKNGIELAVNSINSNGGISGAELKVAYEDDSCDKAKALTTVQKLVGIDKVNIILGPLCSGASLAVVLLAEQQHLLFMSGSATNPKLSDYNLYFRTIPSDAYQGVFAAEFVYNSIGKHKAAIITIQNDYALGVKDAFKKRFLELGGSVAYEPSYSKNTTDLRSEVAKIKSSGADVIYLVPYITDASSFLKQEKEAGLNVQVVSPESINDPKVIALSAGAAEGLIFTKPKSNESKEFDSAYLAAYKTKPSAYDVFYYDATMVLAKAMQKCGAKTECIREQLVLMPAYDGASGVIKFTPSGDIEKAEYTLMTVKDNQFVEYGK